MGTRSAGCAILFACVTMPGLSGCAGSLGENVYLDPKESAGGRTSLAMARRDGYARLLEAGDHPAPPASDYKLAAARREAADQNRQIVEGLFEMGFEAAELASALGRVAAGGVDRALQPRDWLGGGAAGILGGGPAGRSPSRALATVGVRACRGSTGRAAMRSPSTTTCAASWRRFLPVSRCPAGR